VSEFSEPAPSWGAVLLLRLFRWGGQLPLPLLHALGLLLGWLAWLLSASYRRHWRFNVKQAGLSWSQTWRSVGAVGQMITEMPRIWFGPPVSVEWVGREHVDACIDAQRSVLFLTPHLGCFELTVIELARSLGQAKPITVLFQPPNKAVLGPLLEQGRERPGVVAVPTTVSGVKALLQALRKGGMTGLLPDQVPPQGQGVWVPFFGREAYTMTLAARLAHQADVTLLIWAERLSWGRGFRIHVQPAPQGLSPDKAEASAQINTWMEDLIRACPSQYLWGYNRYK
jgi:Kdo2-lipid IVA lauroyltransferase/acyltransferase